jgi:drug/metabolite transporter (DMT)-like permease
MRFAAKQLSAGAVGTLFTAVSALGFSTLPIFGMIAYKAGANVTTLLGVRFFLASVLLWAWILGTRAPLPDWRTGLRLLLMGGAGYTTMSALYLSSVAADRLSPALAALLLYTYPGIVVLLAWLFDGYRLTGRQAAALGTALLGVALVLVAPGAGTVFTVGGALLALGAAVTYGVYILFGSRVTRKTTAPVATTYVTTAAAAVFLLFGAGAGQLVQVAPSGWLAMLGTALFATVLAVLLFFAGIERLGPSRASVISTLEPVGTTLLSAALFHDRLGPWQLGGGLLVLAGIVWLQLGDHGGS